MAARSEISGVTLTAVIVGDEPIIRHRVRNLLEAERDVKIVAECPDGPSAVEAILRHRPDLVFLDVQMPTMNGFDVLRAVGKSVAPVVVLMTSSERVSLRLFDLRALDHLVQVQFAAPVDVHGAAPAAAQVPPSRRIVFRSGAKVVVLNRQDIDWIETNGNYALVHTDNAVHRIRKTLRWFASELDPAVFLRIHRFYIVNVDRVRELQPLPFGRYAVILDGGTRLVTSRSYHPNLRRAFSL